MYRTYNLISNIIFCLNYPARNIIKKNQRFRGIHKDKRCFILGTGPSLNTLNSTHIDCLKHEYIFGVNSLYKSKLSPVIVPQYYVLMDNLYWEQWNQTFSEVQSKYKENPPIFITDLRAKSIVDKIDTQQKSVYIYSKKFPTNEMSEKIDGNIYAAMNVISYSILSAMFMGFKEIYLLGCDYNAFCTAGKGHCYDDESETAQVNYNLAFYLRFYWLTTEFHYLIAKLGKKRGISIVNLTCDSLLDAYPRENVDSVLYCRSKNA